MSGPVPSTYKATCMNCDWGRTKMTDEAKLEADCKHHVHCNPDHEIALEASGLIYVALFASEDPGGEPMTEIDWQEA